MTRATCSDYVTIGFEKIERDLPVFLSECLG